MASRTSPADPVDVWGSQAISAAVRGEVCDENLIALYRDRYGHATAWKLAQHAFTRLLELDHDDKPRVVLKLIVPLLEVDRLDTEPPPFSDIQAQIHDVSPPLLVVDMPVLEARWAIEEYRRALPTSPFGASREGASGAGAMTVTAEYAVYRTLEEAEQGWGYSRQFLFERFPSVR